MLRLRTPFLALCLLAVASPTAHASVSAYRTSPNAGVRHQILLAQAELFRAVAAATRTNPLIDDLKAAHAAVAKARQDYVAALATAKTGIPPTPELSAARASVRDFEGRLADARDADGHDSVRGGDLRLDIATELMDARRRLNALESDALDIDPDLAVSKAALADANKALAAVESRRELAVQQDPQVAAAREKLDELRRQLTSAR